jgi:DNA repair protein RecO (recombination protein O)
LEPFHGLRVALDVAPARELATLAEATLVRPRLELAAHLAAMEAAGQALRWLRRAAAPRTPEPEMWTLMNELLDGLDRRAGAGDGEAKALAAVAGLRLLRVAGWELELTRCVRCAAACPAGASVRVDVAAGGLVCRRCAAPDAGRTVRLDARLREAFAAAIRGDIERLDSEHDGETALALVERMLAVHGRGEVADD